MQLGFVIDQTRCIGCHACTVACKSENDVPVGSFRTWVKYTERGTFPDVRRSFTVLRCNQCTAAPCVTICPVRALHKRPDGIVDIDPGACIGCKACMQACPYDALYLDEGTGLAEKCHFCAHRTEAGLAPACAVVCPTEAIIPGDFEDPASVVSRLRAAESLAARKTEAGTGPNVLYLGAEPDGLDPAKTNASGGFIWADRTGGEPAVAEAFFARDAPVEARTVYDVAHPPPWGRAITGYLFAKSLSAGAFLAGLPLLVPLAPSSGPSSLPLAIPGLGLLFLAITSVLLVADLKRPERFWRIVARPNPRSWLARGTYVLIGYGAALLGWLVLALDGGPAGAGSAMPIFAAATAVLAALAAGYTGWLFAQAKGRVLWMRRGTATHLVVQAIVAGAALLLLLAPALGIDRAGISIERLLLAAGLALHLAFFLAEPLLAPGRREPEYHRASRLVTAGPYGRAHRRLGLAAGILVPLVLLAFPGAPLFWAAAGALALVGLWATEDVFVRAGQAVAIS